METAAPSLDAERAILGRLLLDPQHLGTALCHLRVSTDFQEARHQILYGAMLGLYERSSTMTFYALVEDLARRYQLPQAGGEEYLHGLTAVAIPEDQFADQVRMVKDASLKRQLVEIADGFIREARSGIKDAHHLVTWFDHQVYSLLASRWSAPLFASLEYGLESVLECIAREQRSKTNLSALETGFAELDRMLSRGHADDLLVVAGLPGTGKTGLVLAIARHMALQLEKSVALFSPKASTLQVAQRLVGIEAEVDIHNLTSGKLQEEDWLAVTAASNRLAPALIYTCDDPSLNDLQLRVMTQALKCQKGVELVIIDSLQLMRLHGQDRAVVSRNLKALAVEVGAPVIALLQLRYGEHRPHEERPQLADLAALGYPGLEKAADVVVFVRRLTKEAVEPGDSTCAGELIIARNRHGMTGTVQLTWNAERATYEDRS